MWKCGFQPGLLRDCENFAEDSFEALRGTPHATSATKSEVRLEMRSSAVLGPVHSETQMQSGWRNLICLQNCGIYRHSRVRREAAGWKTWTWRTAATRRRWRTRPRRPACCCPPPRSRGPAPSPASGKLRLQSSSYQIWKKCHFRLAFVTILNENLSVKVWCAVLRTSRAQPATRERRRWPTPDPGIDIYNIYKCRYI